MQATHRSELPVQPPPAATSLLGSGLRPGSGDAQERAQERAQEPRAQGQPRTAKFPTKLRRNYPRSRNGCLTCRQRKKKCDEAKPMCTGCTRNKLSCVWPVPSKPAPEPASEPAAPAAPPPPPPASHPSNLSLFQHKSRWQTYLPSLAAWEGVEGCSVNLNPEYDESGRRTDVAEAEDEVRPTPGGDTNEYAFAFDQDAEQSDGVDVDEPDDGDDEDAAVVAVWSPLVGAFVTDAGLPYHAPRPRRPTGPKRSPVDRPYAFSTRRENKNREKENRNRHGRPRLYTTPRPRATALTALSSSMLRHYIVEAAPTLATNRAARNPYIALILPLAYTDDLVMHCVLAIGGAHRSNRLTKPVPTATGTTSTALAAYTGDRAAATLHGAITQHYSCVLRSLRGALRALEPGDTAQVLRVLTVLLLLSTYECLAWNVLDGGVFAHLRASRQLIAWLRDDGQASSLKQKLSADERSLLGALLEIYAYQVLANRICPDGMIGNRSAAGEDSGLHDDEDFVADPGLLADQDSFGLLFSGLHGLFALIPPVARLAAAALQPDDDATTTTTTTTRLSDMINNPARTATSLGAQVAALRNRALAWQLPADVFAQATGDQERIWQRAIGETYRHSLLIYLETIARPGTAIDLAAIQRHILPIGEAVIGADLVASRFATILLWPLLITGSVLAHPEERVFLAEGLRASPQATWASIKAADVMQAMWERRDAVEAEAAARGSSGSRRYYGPYGLAEIMLETKVNISVG